MLLTELHHPIGGVLPVIVCGFVLAGLVIAASRPCAAGTTVCVTDCGATPDDEGNDAEGFRQAAAYCREHPGTTLTVPAGLYRFRDEKAVEVMRNAMTGQYGNNPQSTLMTREFPHVHGLDFTGAKDVTVKAEGATIRFDGWYQPVVLDRTEGVTIRGLTIDHERAPYSVGRIVEVERKHFDAEFDARYPLNANMPGFCVDFYDADAGRRHGVAHYDARLEMVEPDVLRIHASCPKAYLGDYCIVRHSAHGAAAVMVRYARDLRLDRVTIHSHPGMGIVGHRCENLTFQGVRIVPREGELQSTNTDATHFTSCSGTVVFDGCEFEGQGDDSTNIHNYYHTIKDRIDESTCRMFVDRSAALHALDHDYPEAGDTLELVDARTLAPVRRYTVVSREHNFESSETVATLDDVLLEDCRGYRFVNVTRFPSVRIVNCHIRSHLARGILIKTRDVLIEGCTIENTTGTGIHVGAEGDWHEGAPTADLTIRNNRIVHCGLGHGTQNDACAIAINVKAQDTTVPGLHKRVLIEDNEIVGLNAKRGIFASSVEGLTIRNNRFDGCDEPIHVEYSTSVQVCNNHGAVPNIGPGVKIRGAE